MSVKKAPFHGDGRYPGDGGAALEALWQLMPWREIRNCPGGEFSRLNGNDFGYQPLKWHFEVSKVGSIEELTLWPVTFFFGGWWVRVCVFFFAWIPCFFKDSLFFCVKPNVSAWIELCEKPAEQQKIKTTGRYTTSDREALELCFPIMICNLKR